MHTEQAVIVSWADDFVGRERLLRTEDRNTNQNTV